MPFLNIERPISMMPDMTEPTYTRPELLFAVDLQEPAITLDHHQTEAWLAVGTASGTVLLYHTGQNHEAARWTAHNNGLYTLHWHPTAPLLATSGQDGFVRIWAIDAHGVVNKLHELKTAQDGVEHLAWRSDGKQLAIASGKDIRLFSDHAELQGTFHFPYSTISALSWRPQGVQLAVAGNGGIMLYNVLDPNLKPRKLYFKGSLLSMAWSPDGQTIAVGCQDHSVHFWHLKDGNDVMLTGYENKPKQLSWSSNSRYLTATGTRDLMIWAFDGRTTEQREPIILPFHQKPITAIAFAPKGQWLAAGCKEGKLSIWQKLTAEHPAYTLHGKSSIERIAWIFTQTTLKLAAITDQGILGVWRILDK